MKLSDLTLSEYIRIKIAGVKIARDLFDTKADDETRDIQYKAYVSAFNNVIKDLESDLKTLEEE